MSLPYPWWNANRLNLVQNHICSKAMSAMACVSRRQHFTAPPYPPAGMFFLPPLPWRFLNLGFSFFLTFGFLYPIYKTLVRNLELVSTKITCELELCPVVFRKKGNSEAWWNGSLPAPVGARKELPVSACNLFQLPAEEAGSPQGLPVESLALGSQKRVSHLTTRFHCQTVWL